MCQCQESIRPWESIPAGLRSNWDIRWLLLKYHESDCDKFGNTLVHQREPEVHQGAPGSAGNRPGSTDDKPGSTDDKHGSPADKSGNTSNRSRAVWETQLPLCERCWCTWKSYLLLIVQRFLKLMYLECILIYVSMYLCIYVSIVLPIYTRYIWTGCRRCLGAIGGAPQNDE